MPDRSLLILWLPGAEGLAHALARPLGAETAPVASHRFPDGETLVRIDVPVAGRRVLFAARLDRPDDKTLPLLFAADAARELGAAQVGLVAPYLPYMRQDQRFHPGEAITSRSFARVVSASFDALFTVDPHLHRIARLDDIYALRAEVVAAAPAIADWLRREVPRPLLVGPDSESEQWVRDVAARVDAPWTVLAKERRGDRDVQVAWRSQPDWQGRTPVLLDDIISTGHTLMAAAQALLAAGQAAPVCIGVHALFDAAAAEVMQAAGMARVVTCDTIEHPTNAISLAPLLADAVRRWQK